jgi:hypothetical protein
VNTREVAQLDDWDEKTLAQLVARYVRLFHRLPSQDELVLFRSARGQLQLRLPAQRRRKSLTRLAFL